MFIKKIVAPKLVKKLPVGNKGINCKTKKDPALRSIKFLDEIKLLIILQIKYKKNEINKINPTKPRVDNISK